MKKYLMGGMAAFALCATFTSCSHDEDLFTSLEESKTIEYQTAFVTAFGEISQTQDWGFNTTNVTRADDPDANMWGGNGAINSRYPEFTVPQPLTDAQKNVVRKWFQTHQNPDNHAVNYTNFFVQQVYKGGMNLEGSQTTETYLAGNGDVVVGASKMDYLMAGQVGTALDWQNNEQPVYDHMYNFNGANYSGGAKNVNVWDGQLDPDESLDFNNRKICHEDQIQLMVNSSTSSFGYHTSQSSEQFHNKYVVIPGDIIDPSVAGMYFVGFDYEATGNNPNEYIVTEDEGGNLTVNNHEGTYSKGGADGYYSDWIVRITKAEGDNDRVVASGRIFCEDLGSSYDFDFNDIVFDAYIYQSGKIKITLQAAGGQLKAYIGEIAADKSNEVHKLLGTDMVNTGLKTASPYTFWIDAVAEGTPKFATLKDIPVYVIQQNAAHYEETIMLKAEIGSAPQKICFPLNAKWPDEYVDIEAAYPNWRNWISQRAGITTAVEVVEGGWVEDLVDLDLTNNGIYTNRYGRQ